MTDAELEADHADSGDNGLPQQAPASTVPQLAPVHSMSVDQPQLAPVHSMPDDQPQRAPVHSMPDDLPLVGTTGSRASSGPADADDDDDSRGNRLPLAAGSADDWTRPVSPSPDLSTAIAPVTLAEVPEAHAEEPRQSSSA